MSDRKHKNQNEVTPSEIEEINKKTEKFFTKNAKILYGLIGFVLLSIMLYLGYTQVYLEKMETEYLEKSLMADRYFEKDSMAKAFDGRGYLGYKQLVDRYGNTEGGNLAAYKAGLALYQLKKYDEAKEYFQKFDTQEEVMASMKTGLIADCDSQLGELDKATEGYLKAAEESEVVIVKSHFYRKAINALLYQGENQKAKEIISEIREKNAAIIEENSFLLKIEQMLNHSEDGNS